MSSDCCCGNITPPENTIGEHYATSWKEEDSLCANCHLYKTRIEDDITEQWPCKEFRLGKFYSCDVMEEESKSDDTNQGNVDKGFGIHNELSHEKIEEHEQINSANKDGILEFEMKVEEKDTNEDAEEKNNHSCGTDVVNLEVKSEPNEQRNIQSKGLRECEMKKEIQNRDKEEEKEEKSKTKQGHQHVKETKTSRAKNKSNSEIKKNAAGKFECPYCPKTFIGSYMFKCHVRIHTGETIAECGICQKKFKKIGNYNRHLKIHQKIKDYKCLHCTKAFVTNTELKTHIRIHTGEIVLECEICHKNFSRKDYYFTHMKIHQNSKDHKCHYCPKAFITKDALKNHTRIHTGEAWGECEICHKKFNQKSNYNTHMKSHPNRKDNKSVILVDTNSAETVAECEICHKKFRRKYYYNNHMKNHHRSKDNHVKPIGTHNELSSKRIEKNEQTNIANKDGILKFEMKLEEKDTSEDTEEKNKHSCGTDVVKLEVKSEPNEQRNIQSKDLRECEMKKEIQNRDKEEEKEEKSKIKQGHSISLQHVKETKTSRAKYKSNAAGKLRCLKAFRANSKLKRHLRIHMKEAVAECEICHQKFNQLENFNTHMKVHQQNVKDYKCSHCPKTFVANADLKLHTSIHAGIGQTVPECGICKQKFKKIGNYSRHLTIAHKSKHCPHCKKAFETNRLLKRHIRTHTGESVAECEICQKKFDSNSNYNRHLKVHQELKDYRCPQCPKSFVRNQELKTHMRIHTGKTVTECEICHKNFSRKDNYYTHMKIHQNIKDYKCPHCPKAFVTSTNLKIHVPSHTGEVVAQCGICRQKFQRRSSYNTHMRKFHLNVQDSKV